MGEFSTAAFFGEADGSGEGDFGGADFFGHGEGLFFPFFALCCVFARDGVGEGLPFFFFEGVGVTSSSDLGFFFFAVGVSLGFGVLFFFGDDFGLDDGDLSAVGEDFGFGVGSSSCARSNGNAHATSATMTSKRERDT